MSDSVPLLQVKGLHAYYKDAAALHGIDFEIGKGQVVALLGANGAGKTTTLRAVCGMVRTRGSIVLDGQDITQRATESIVRMGVAHVPEGRGTFAELTVAENLRLGGIERRDSRAVAKDFELCLEYFPRLKERLQQQAGTLSGGEQQMLAISRALMLGPRLILLDEPSFGLAPLIVEEIFAIMRRINRNQKVSMLLVEQNARLAVSLADQVYLMETGRMVMSGTSADLSADEHIQRAYLGYSGPRKSSPSAEAK